MLRTRPPYLPFYSIPHHYAFLSLIQQSGMPHNTITITGLPPQLVSPPIPKLEHTLPGHVVNVLPASPEDSNFESHRQILKPTANLNPIFVSSWPDTSTLFNRSPREFTTSFSCSVTAPLHAALRYPLAPAAKRPSPTSLTLLASSR